MLRRLQRAKQQLPFSAPRLGAEPASTLSGSSNSSSQQTRSSSSSAEPTYPAASLLGLPPELRNEIYALVASDTRLIMPVIAQRRTRPAALLAVCRRTAREFAPILLARAHITLPVLEYDFGPAAAALERSRGRRTGEVAVIGRNRRRGRLKGGGGGGVLEDDEGDGVVVDDDLAALSQNPRLEVQLRIAHCAGVAERRQVLAWSRLRATAAPRDHVAFAYVVKLHWQIRPPRPPVRYANGYHMRWELLREHVRMLRAVAAEAEAESGGMKGECDEIGWMIEDVKSCMDGYAQLAMENGSPPLRLDGR